ncbi:uncharacterized protein LOC125946718 [Dermacentor silvarum]|uniref:uncharacterized protein LOC125946718 n=1 Tax=Dermacentor silvarum TaxID=543639 RepID=UPI0021011BF1|nr:uncharacterized protein LOC125946718 [Dermacentor silvarum]
MNDSGSAGMHRAKTLPLNRIRVLVTKFIFRPVSRFPLKECPSITRLALDPRAPFHVNNGTPKMATAGMFCPKTLLLRRGGRSTATCLGIAKTFRASKVGLPNRVSVPLIAYVSNPDGLPTVTGLVRTPSTRDDLESPTSWASRKLLLEGVWSLTNGLIRRGDSICVWMYQLLPTKTPRFSRDSAAMMISLSRQQAWLLQRRPNPNRVFALSTKTVCKSLGSPQFPFPIPFHYNKDWIRLLMGGFLYLPSLRGLLLSADNRQTRRSLKLKAFLPSGRGAHSVWLLLWSDRLFCEGRLRLKKRVLRNQFPLSLPNL